MTAAFLTDLKTECVDDLACEGRGIWRITAPLVFNSEILGKTITVEPGFLTDYASVPRVPVAYLLFGDTTHIAAVIHDWLFHHHEVCDEQTANSVLLEAAKAEGISTWRRFGIYAGVYVGGESSWKADGNSNGHSIVNGVIV